MVNEEVTPGMYSPAHIIDTPVHANQGTGSHVPDEAIVLDGKIASRELPHLPIATGTVGRGIGRHGELWFECTLSVSTEQVTLNTRSTKLL